MHKKRPDFADDLSGIQKDVANDVGKILEIANSTRHEPDRVGSIDPSGPPPIVQRQTHTKKRLGVNRTLVAPKSIATHRATLVNVTTRLTHDTNELLTEAALRQRLKKTSPATRQDIIQRAIDEWLAANEYTR